MYNKNRPALKALMTPLLVMGLGLVLILSPDTASVLLSNLAGWVLIAIGILVGVLAVLSDRQFQLRLGITAVVLVLAGGWLKANPLAIAAWAGRLAGILLLIQGLPGLLASLRQGKGSIRSGVTVILGAVLFLVPMATSRLIASLVGIALLCLGIAMLADQLRRPNLDQGRPDIIDADE